MQEAAQDALAALPIEQADALQHAMRLRLATSAPSPATTTASAAGPSEAPVGARVGKEARAEAQAEEGGPLEEGALDAEALQLAMQAMGRLASVGGGGGGGGGLDGASEEMMEVLRPMYALDPSWASACEDPTIAACDAAAAAAAAAAAEAQRRGAGVGACGGGMGASHGASGAARRSLEPQLRQRQYGDVEGHAELGAACLSHQLPPGCSAALPRAPTPAGSNLRPSSPGSYGSRGSYVATGGPQPGTTAFLRARANSNYSAAGSHRSKASCASSFRKVSRRRTR